MEPVRIVTAKSAVRAIVIAFLAGMLLGGATGVIGVTLGVYNALEDSR